MGRSKLKTLKETTLNTFFELSSQLGITDQWDYNQQAGIIKWTNGSEIILKDLFLYPSDPEFDSLGSLEITGAFIDECNQLVYKAWQVVKSRIRYKLKEYDLIPKMLGTCNPAKNWVYRNFYLADKPKSIPDNRRFIQALPTDNPHLPKSYLESLLELDKNSKERLYFGNWEYDDDPSALISFEKIQDMYSNKFVPQGERYLTADVATYGSDKFVIAIWSGWRLEDLIVIDKCEGDEVVQIIRANAYKYMIAESNIAIDVDGVGNMLRGYFRNAYSFKNNGKTYAVQGSREEYANLKSQCYFYYARQVSASKVFVNCEVDEQIFNEEHEVIKNYTVDKDQKLRVLPKEKVKELIGRSPDITDALMMRSIFDLKPRRGLRL